MTILLGITSSIAAYKTPALVRLLRKKGADVYCVLSQNAAKLVAPKTLETLSGNRVIETIWTERDPLVHINLTKEADVFLIAPATANVIAKLAVGIADDAMTTMALAFDGKKYIAPAMNPNMYAHPATVRNLRLLADEQHYSIIEPGYGDLACDDEGLGRLAQIDSIVTAVYGEQVYSGKTVVVSSGATREWIDPIRFITNRSSGRMGKALAERFLALGASVIYIEAGVDTPAPPGVMRIQVETTKEMEDAVLCAISDADALVMAAAPLDVRPKNQSQKKLKKDTMRSLELVETADILMRVRETNMSIRVVAFAAESEDLLAYAEAKMKKKGADMIVANTIDEGFGTKMNTISILHADGSVRTLPKMSKAACAQEIVQDLADLL